MGRTNTSSNAARQRRKEKRAKKGGKAGCPGNFHGERADFIDANFPQYLLVKGSRKAEGEYWRQLFQSYWAKFQWNLPFDRDPDPAFPPPPTEMEEVLEQKTLVIQQTQDVRPLAE